VTICPHKSLHQKGEIYDLSQFECTTVPGWGGQSTDPLFSATLVGCVTGSDYFDDYEYVVVAR
jgi:hypothetical protein